MKEDVCMMTSQPDRDVVNETDNCRGAWAGPVSWLGTWNVRMCCVTPLLGDDRSHGRLCGINCGTRRHPGNNLQPP